MREIPYRLHTKIADHDASSPIEHLRWSPEFDVYLDAVTTSLEDRRWYRWWEQPGMFAYLTDQFDAELVTLAIAVRRHAIPLRYAARSVGRTERWLRRQIAQIQDAARA